MFFHDGPPIRVLRPNRAVIRSLPAGGEALRRETKRFVDGHVPEEILLLKTEPEIIVVVFNGGASVALVRGTVGVEHLTHDEVAIPALRVHADKHRLQQTVRRTPFGLLGGGAVERPHGAVVKVAGEIRFNFGFGTQALRGLVAIEPNVF